MVMSYPDFDLASLWNRIIDTTRGSEPDDSPAELAQIFRTYHNAPLKDLHVYHNAPLSIPDK